ncbi:uncharacterized protein J4E78_001631 [Alternaria triticimaculans]|uniref:uncharacterized protein n=1 Tax=Alternaria triticimaculans TaxID=297637 RepID=UPI0020C3D2BB|nr:uncharacterized protein J4E78_001631 [Alternaria triticimaculans]KAI4673124.1 hypothetical protein J4E78_001631 [Alternaria triticimaculans]
MDLSHLLSSSLAPVQETLISFLGPKDFATLAEVSTSVRTALSGGLPSCYQNIETKLKTFFEDPKAFRQVQANTGAIIGGDFARKFIANELQTPVQELYIYTQYSEVKPLDLRAPIFDFLEQERWIADEYNKTGLGVFRKPQAEYDGLTICVLDSRDSPLCKLLHAASSTASLNFVTWNRAYSLFPQTTFIDKQCYVLQNLPADKTAGMVKRHGDYLRGLTCDGIQTRFLHWDDKYTNPITRPRRVGDKYTYTIGLDPTGIDCSTLAIPQTVVELSTFKIKLWHWRNSNGGRGPITSYVMSAIGVDSAVLKQSYVVLHEDEKDQWEPDQPAPSRLFKKTIHLVCQIGGLTILELAKLPESDRPIEYNNIINGRSREAFGWKSTKVPETWSYYDDDFMKQLGKLWREHERDEMEKGDDRTSQ